MAQDRPVEAIDEAHPDVVALMYGPLVLFAKTIDVGEFDEQRVSYWQ